MSRCSLMELLAIRLSPQAGKSLVMRGSLHFDLLATFLMCFWYLWELAVSQLFLGQRLLALVARHFLELDQMRFRVWFVDHQDLADVLHRRSF
jgi:hypothetical protein